MVDSGLTLRYLKSSRGGRVLPCFDFKKNKSLLKVIYFFFINIKFYYLKYTYLIFKKLLQYLYFFINLKYN